MDETVILNPRGNYIRFKPYIQEEMNIGLSPRIYGVSHEIWGTNNNVSYCVEMQFSYDETLDNVLQGLQNEFFEFIGFDIHENLIYDYNSTHYEIFDRMTFILRNLIHDKFRTKDELFEWIRCMINNEPYEEKSILDICDNKYPVSEDFMRLLSL